MNVFNFIASRLGRVDWIRLRWKVHTGTSSSACTDPHILGFPSFLEGTDCLGISKIAGGFVCFRRAQHYCRRLIGSKVCAIWKFFDMILVDHRIVSKVLKNPEEPLVIPRHPHGRLRPHDADHESLYPFKPYLQLSANAGSFYLQRFRV